MANSSIAPLIQGDLHVNEGGKVLVAQNLIGDVIVSQDTDPQPKLELFEALRKDDSSILATDLQFKRRATSYQSRPKLQAKVIPWLHSVDSFGILKITGPAGMGKSRLALELCDRFHRDGWLAGFVDVKEEWPANWTPIRDTLAVLDYGTFKRFRHCSAFEWLHSIYIHTKRPSRPHPVARVRIVLLDRADQGPLWSDWRSSEIALDLDKQTLALELTPDHSEFDAIVEEELRRRGHAALTDADRNAIATVAERLRGQVRPLFALLTAAALAEGQLQLGTTWSPELLVESILKAQRRQWEAAALTDEHLDLLFEATLTQGACRDNPEFCKRLEAFEQATLDSLTTLCEPSFSIGAITPVGPIAPDLLGEFFVLMRLRGDEQMRLKRQTGKSQTISRTILQRSWDYEPAESFLARMLEDYLTWEPQTGGNPTLEVMDQALSLIESGRASFGLQYCCFATAWKRPAARDWSAWLSRVPDDNRHLIASALSIGLFNATVVEPDPVKRVALADRIEALHAQHGQEAAVRELLAKALTNATVVEPDPARRLALADRIQALHTQHGQEAAIRESLAKALTNATVVEPDPAKRLALADRIQALHAQYGQEAAIREQLAQALFNATLVEPDPAKRLALADRIQALHTQHGQEAAVREALANALFGATVGERDPVKRLALADRIQALHTQHGQEAAVREALANALFNATVGEPDPAKRLALADRIQALHTQHGQEAAVREPLAQALINATAIEPDPAKRLALADRVQALHTQHGQEAPVREQLAQALFNATTVEPDPAKRLALAARIQALHTQHGQEAPVRELLARALTNATTVEPDPAKRLALADRIQALHTQHGQEAPVREQLAKTLFNVTLVEPDAAKCLALADRIQVLHTQHGQEAAVREPLAQALTNATAVEPDPAKRLALVDRIQALHAQHGQEPAVCEALAKALTNATAVEPHPDKRLVLANRIKALRTDPPYY